MVNYTWSYSFRPPSQDQREALWIWEDAHVYPLSDTDCLLRNKRTRAEAVIRLDVLNALQLCRQFRTLDAHVQAICTAIPALAQQQANVRQVLETLARQGILRSTDDLLKELQAPTDSSAMAPVEPLFIRTCNRPELLERLLPSLVANENRFANSYRYIVLDDSTQEVHREKNAVLIAAYTDRLRVQYCGIPGQRRLMARLTEALPRQAESLRWLLVGSGQNPGKTYGRGWNHALLLGAGCRLLMMDDDALCQAYKPPRTQAGIEISMRDEQAWFYENRDAVLEGTEPAEVDPLAQHAGVLGLTLSQVIRHCPDGPLSAQSLQHLTPEALTALDASSPILMTGNSVFGDPGTGSNHWLFLNLEGEWRRQFVHSELEYRQNCVERHLWKGYASLHLAPDKSLMTTTLTGFDNRRLLPPTTPELAGEDGLFGAALKYLYPASLDLQFPWGLPHLPEPPRNWGQTAFEKPLSPPVVNLMEDLAGSARSRCVARLPEQRLKSLASLYEDLAQAEDRVIEETIQEYGLAARASVVRRLNRALQTFKEAPDYWRVDVQRIIRANSRITASGEKPDADRQTLATTRDMLGHYATALRSWPAIWNYCQQNQAELLEDVLNG